MQVFIFDNPLETALKLDVRRFHSQIREAKIVLKWCNLIKCGEGKRWINQPLAQMYLNNTDWLELYVQLFEAVKATDMDKANELNQKMLYITPKWHSLEYYAQMKRRLYTKNKTYYKDWEFLGESYDNWYWVDEKWKIIPQ